MDFSFFIVNNIFKNMLLGVRFPVRQEGRQTGEK